MESAFVLADTDLIAAWAISIALTLVLIGLPALYVLVLILADDDSAFDRRVRDIEQQIKLKQRAQVYASGRDVFNVLEEPDVVRPLAGRLTHARPPLEHTATG